MVRRTRSPMSRPAQRGIEFEDAVYRCCDNVEFEKPAYPTSSNDLFQEVVKSCIGGKFQTKLKRKEEFEGFTAVFYGKLDVEFPKSIIDIKTTENYRGAQKYLNGYQHEMYPWMANLARFKYIVAVLDPDRDLVVKELNVIEHTITTDLTDKMRGYVGKVIHGMKSRGLYDDYVNKFSYNGRKK